MAVKAASDADKLLVVNFTGVNDINSRIMENDVLSVSAVRDVIEHMVRVQVFVDRIPGSDATEAERRRLLKRNCDLHVNWLKDSATPVFVIATPDGTEILSRFVGLNPDVSEFQRFLADGLRKWQARTSTAATSDAPM